MAGTRPEATPGAKMVYLIKRKTQTSREELIAHWFANHMRGVIDRNLQNREADHPSADHYVATLFDPRKGLEHDWDGVAQLWYDAPLRRPAQASGVEPYDTFQQVVEPYWPWATQEYVVLDGGLPLKPLTLNDPFPCTRSGFFKLTFLIALKKGVDRQALFDHWIDVHVPNVRDLMGKIGGFRYVVSHSLEPDTEPYAGMAELYFPDESGWNAYRAEFEPDGFSDFIDAEATLRFHSGTEMVGIE
ncbi:MAG: EthD domain-containing protein [Candidatus Latescibacterota bacterium]